LDTDAGVVEEVAAEQAYLDHAYRCLAAMRDRAGLAAQVAAEDGAAQEVDSAIAAWHLRRRRDALDPNVPSLSFGRLDEEAGDTWYVGRRHVEDGDGDPVVVDWRARVSVPFYRATAADAMGLRRRRRFLMDGTRLVDLMDEVFDDPDSVHAAMHGGIPDPLLAELERARTGEMRDIVATIQAEQDVVIRAPLGTCLVVQGGPGTGKTAVGLHRAAFLLYEHRQQLDEQGVLVVGPNPVFLRYIAQVLPSLGETAVRQTTIERLLGSRVRAFDSLAAARVKGDARMAAVIEQACRAQLRPPTDDLELSTHWGSLRVPAQVIGDAIEEIAARNVAFNVGRGALRTQLQRLVYQQHVERRGDDVAAPDAFEADLRANRAFQSALGRAWPAISAPALVRRLLSSATALRVAADGHLEAHEQERLLRKATKRADDEPWTVADLVLVDEAEWRVNGVPRTYGHVVVDEAQDLSAMELRLLARRCPSRSMTVLGDLAQATAPGAQRSWEDAMAHLGSPSQGQLAELELGYRVPGPVLDVANQLLPLAAPDVQPSRSVRTEGAPPMFAAVDAEEHLGVAVAAAVAEAATRWTSVGVVVPDDVSDAVAAALRDAGVAYGEGLRVGLGERVTVLPPPAAKGLEFDAVVVVEPAAIMGGTASGARLLYIAMTRCVQELTVVHARPLPTPLSASAPITTFSR
jgi:DNA helicase IV